MIFGNMAVFARSLHLGRFAFAALFLFAFVGNVWAYSCNVNQYQDCGNNYVISGGSCSDCPSKNPNGQSPLNFFSACTKHYYGALCSFCSYCTDQCATDSIVCVQSGYNWIIDNNAECGKSCTSCDEQCQCEEQPGMIWNGTECVEDSSLCAEDRATCVRAGGVFAGSTNTGCCISTCDLCNNATMLRWKNLKTAECCNEGMAPPDSIRDCRTMSSDECGMSISTLTTMTTTDYKCQDPNLNAQVKQRFFDQCFEPASSSSEGGPGSSSGGGTSSEGGTSSAGDYGDCQECPWLDSILDTLTRTKKNTDDIVTCLTTPNLCAGLSIKIPDSIKTPVFAFDTAFRKYLKPLMDSSLKLDSNQLKALMKLDTNILKQLRTDSVKLQNDTNTWRVVEGAGDQVDTSIHSMNDTTRKWFKRIADSIGVSTDSLAVHLDSILEHIPDSILDSIVKYQQYATDNFDSVLFGHGKGFSLVDSLIDSSVKYFKESNQKWNEYISMYGDSTQKIHEEILDLPGRNASAIGYALGYGDTATSTLRGDLEGVRGAIEGLGDGIGSGVAGALDSAIGSGSGADTAGVGFGWLADGDALADSIIDGSGYGGLDFAGDSSMRDSLLGAGYVCDDTSCCVRGECFYFDSDTKIQDSLARFVSAYGDTLAQKNSEYLSDSVSGIFQDVKESLMVYNPVGIFDSTVLSTLGMKIPNTNTCPEHCSKFEVDIPFMFGTQHFTIDYGLCLGRAAFADGNVLSFLRFIIRVVVAFTCISAVMWNAARLKR